ncbi:MAG TPA: hypothetical protein ENK88_02095, partial [Campylobacterales bacterium]|nr:hypothetical protein [Campylobacterales bacterium]
ELKKGWNLISLPIDSVVSPDIFEGLTVWRYNPDNKWELYDSSDTLEDFPPIQYIKNSDALWVKAPIDTNISVAKELSKLHNFSSKEEMKEYIKDMYISNTSHWGIEPLYMDMGLVEAVPTSAEVNTVGASDSSSSQVRNTTDTNIQESGVDEADILKHNNKYIFYVVKNSKKPYIKITSFDKLSKKDSTPIDTISFADSRQINSMYISDNKLIVLSNNYDITTMGSMGNPSSPTQYTHIDIFDISDINSIRNISSTKIDGNIINSRVIGKELYTITTFSPRMDIKYPKKYITLSPICQEFFNRNNNIYPVNETSITEQTEKEYDPNRYSSCYGIEKDYSTDKYYRYDYDNPIVKEKQIIPQIENSSNPKEDLVKAEKLYAPKKLNQLPNITTITHISISDGEYKSSNSFIGYSSTQYASANALYLVSDIYPIYYDFNNYKERSIIYKFDFNNNLDYRGKGSVYGHTLNQFSLSEYNNILRIATTEGFSWNRNGTKNSIYTLKNENESLKIQGILSGLGKENEVIKSVRFIGDKGFVVTFEQTDPFYTIDLSDPTAPQKVGELQVNGYSAYLHPVGVDKILGVGQDADSEGRVQGLKLELFDISDLANPTSLDSIKYSNTSSELLYNHKALAYRTSDNLFAFPYNVYGNYTKDYLGIYQIKDDKIATYSPINSSNSDWSNSRGLIFDMNSTTFVSFFTNSDIITQDLNTTAQ